MKRVPYYVTRTGITAALGDDRLLEEMRSALFDVRPPQETVDRLLKEGHIALEKRGSVTLGDAVAAAKKPTAADRPRPRVAYHAVRPGSQPRNLPEQLAQVFGIFGEAPLTFPEVERHLPDMARNTLRWAIQVLRQRRLIRSVAAP